MKHQRLYIYSLILLIATLGFSCKKENTIYPSVEIKAPIDSHSYSFGDTVKVSLEVLRRNGHVSLDLMDGGTVVSLAHNLVYEDGTHLEYELYFTDRYLSSGKYDLRVKVFNGENSSSDFLKLSYQELLLRMRGLVALSREEGSPATITRYDSSGSVQTKTLMGDYSYLAFNSFQQIFSIAPVKEGTLQGFNFKSFEKIYELSNPGNAGLWKYEHMFSSDRYIFALESEGGMKGINPNGTLGRSGEAPQGYIPQYACIGEPGLLLAARLDGKDQYALFLQNPQNGSVLKTTTIPGKVKAMAYVGQNLFAVVYEENGDAVITTYQIDDNVLTEYARLAGEVPLSLLVVSDHYLLISTKNRILRFDPHISQVPVGVHNFSAIDMEYDKAGDRIYYASGYSILAGIPGAAPIPVISTADSVQQIEIAYNK